MIDPNNAQPPRHGVIKRTIGGSFARSWPPPLPLCRRCCVLPRLLLRGLSAAAKNRCAVLASAVLLCACSRTYGASSRELGERHASCDILPLLLQLRLLRCASSYCRRRRCCCCCYLFCGCCEYFYVLPPPPLLLLPSAAFCCCFCFLLLPLLLLLSVVVFQSRSPGGGK